MRAYRLHVGLRVKITLVANAHLNNPNPAKISSRVSLVMFQARDQTKRWAQQTPSLGGRHSGRWPVWRWRGQGRSQGAVAQHTSGRDVARLLIYPVFAIRHCDVDILERPPRLAGRPKRRPKLSRAQAHVGGCFADVGAFA
jgi:hypothetical protein